MLVRKKRHTTAPVTGVEKKLLLNSKKRHKSLLTPSEWTRICGVYMKNNAEIFATSVELGWPIARTRRVYLRGYPSCGLPPVKEVLARDADSAEEVRAARHELDVGPQEAIETIVKKRKGTNQTIVIARGEAERVRMLVEREEMRRKSRADMIQSRAEEAMMISLNRRNSLALNGVTSQLLKGALALSEKIQQKLEEEARNEDLSALDGLQLLKQTAQIGRYNSEATMLAAKAERIVMGQPIEALAEESTDGTLEGAVDWIQRSSAALQRAIDRGVVVNATGEAADSTEH